MFKISFIFGTRPEAIKLSPVIISMKELKKEYKINVCVTAQHREMLDQVLKVFGIIPDVDLSLMEPNQTLASLTSKSIIQIDRYLKNIKPDMVIVQGDTSTVFCAALAAFYNQIPVGHVEAGLRTGNRLSPFPEEINRVLTTHLANVHFAPTATSKNNLINEGVDMRNIYITGNTVVDALKIGIERLKQKSIIIPGISKKILDLNQRRPIILITGHRRENIGRGFENICAAITKLSIKYPFVQFVYPLHLNPNVRGPVKSMLGIDGTNQSKNKNIYLIEPLEYLPFLYLMRKSKIILTDSGGIQEEAPSLGKPVLVMRDTTERPEAIQSGSVKLVGTDVKSIVENVSMLLNDKIAYKAMAKKKNPYGDGKARYKIISACSEYFKRHSSII